MSRRSTCAVTADRAVAKGTSSAGRTISTTLRPASRPCGPRQTVDPLCCLPTPSVAWSAPTTCSQVGPCRTCWCCRRLRSTTACRAGSTSSFRWLLECCRRSRSRIRGARRPCLVIRRWGGWCSWTQAVQIGRRSGWARSGSRRRNACGRGWPRWPCRRSCSTAWTIVSCHQRRPSPSRGCLASPDACTRGFGTRRSTSWRARGSSPTSSRGCARRWTGGRPSRSHALGK